MSRRFRRGELGDVPGGGELLLGVGEPRLVGVLADDAERDWHEGVILAADLGALAVIDALALRLEPGFVVAPRHRVDADAERLDYERMDYVGRSHRDLDDLVD